MTRTITLGDDVIDSRDVIALLADADALAELEPEEVADWQDFAAQGEDAAADWTFGETFVHDDYFVDYAEQLAEDIGAIDANANWPTCHIDWQAAARSLQHDYTPITVRGHTYWTR